MSKNQITKIRHSLAHLLAMAVIEKFPQVKLGIGPTIENGFYYDFDFSVSRSNYKRIRANGSRIAEEDLFDLEERIRELTKQNLRFKKETISFNEAKKLFKDQPYKLELIEELKKSKKPITIYKTLENKVISHQSSVISQFIDLCAGLHIKSTKEIDPEAFKLTKIAGAYWHGDEKKPMLTRIYGIAFETKKELENYLTLQEEAEKRDHRILGQKLELFTFDQEVGAGLPLWLPKGAILRHSIEEFLFKELLSEGYQWLVSPHIANLNLWKTSGHWGFYRENMYSPIKIEKEEYLLKPMNCPFHLKVYKSKIRSWRDLPLRFAELGTVYRYERSGVLHGLTRVRGFTQDDAHIFTTPEELAGELLKLLNFATKILKQFGFEDYEIYLSTRPQKYIGTIKSWDKATKALEYALKKSKLPYQIDPGEGVFYGPKIDIKIRDILGRSWQCTTIQVDLNLPERFDIIYIDNKGKKQRPIMIHRAILGSLERFIGILLEHHAGSLPLWLSPVQVKIINVGASQRNYAWSVLNQLKEAEIRAELSDENLTVSKRIREAEIQKMPYIIVTGEREIKNETVSIRQRDGKDIEVMPLEAFIKKIKDEIEKKL